MNARANPLRGRRWLHPVPAVLRDPDQRRPLLGWLGIGLLVRLLVAPFTLHSDMLATYWRAHLIAYDGAVYGEYLVNMGAHYTQALSLRILDPLLPAQQVLWSDPWWWSDGLALTRQITRDWLDLPGTFGTLLTLKLPFLAFDMAAGLLVLALAGMAADARHVRRAWAFWMLSPIGLYASYAFGRYEMFAVAFILGALMAAEREHPWWAAVLLGVAVTMRGYPILLIPIFGLIVMRRPLQRALWAATAIAPFALVLASNKLVADSVGEFANLREYSTGSTFLAYSLPIDQAGDLYLFILFSVVVYAVLIGRAYGWWGTGPVPLAQLWIWLALFHVGMFALMTISAHYFAWITPFVALAIARRPQWRGILPLHLLQVAGVLALADLRGGPEVTWSLLQPLQPDIVDAVPTLREAVLTQPDAAAQLSGLLITGVTGLLVLTAWPMVVELWTSAVPRRPAPSSPAAAAATAR